MSDTYYRELLSEGNFVLALMVGLSHLAIFSLRGICGFSGNLVLAQEIRDPTTGNWVFSLPNWKKYLSKHRIRTTIPQEKTK